MRSVVTGRPGGRAKVYGSHQLRGSPLTTYRVTGSGSAVEKSATTIGWAFTMHEESWNDGLLQKMQHLVDCVVRDEPPLVIGEDGGTGLESIHAADRSAGTGRAVARPLGPVARPSRSTSGSVAASAARTQADRTDARLAGRSGHHRPRR